MLKTKSHRHLLRFLLYSALFRLHLDYCVPFGASQHKTDVNKVEQVQQRAFKTGAPSCEKRQRELDLFSLEKKHLGQEKGGTYCQKFTKRTIRLSRQVTQSFSVLGDFLDPTGYSHGPPGLTSELLASSWTRALLTCFPNWMSLRICSFHLILLIDNPWLSLNSSQRNVNKHFIFQYVIMK